jgi:O-antigen/teichoic acid export membrane protein
MSLTANLLGYAGDVRVAMYAASLVLIPSGMSIVCWGVFKAYEKNIYFSIVAIIDNALRVGLSIIALHAGCGLAGLMLISLASSFTGLFLGYLLIRKKIIHKIKFKIDLQVCKRILRSTITFAMISIVVSLHWRVGVIILEKVEGSSAVGIFSAAFRLFNMIESFIIAFGLSVFPNISRRFGKESDGFERISVDSARYIVIVVFLLACVTTFLSGDIIRLIYGVKFMEAERVLQVLVWASVPFSMVTVFAYSLFSSFKQRVDLTINVIGVLSNVLLCLLLVPRFSYLGLSFAIVGSTCVLLICQRIFINENLFRLRLTKIMGPPFLSSLGMVACVFVLRPILNLYLLLAGSIFVYFFILLLLKGLKEKELVYLKRYSMSLIQYWKLFV